MDLRIGIARENFAADPEPPDKSLAFIGSAAARDAGVGEPCCRGTFDNET